MYKKIYKIEKYYKLKWKKTFHFHLFLFLNFCALKLYEISKNQLEIRNNIKINNLYLVNHLHTSCFTGNVLMKL